MKITSPANIFSKNKTSLFVLHGYIEVEDISPCINSLFISSKNLMSIHALSKNSGLEIDFKKWLNVIEKQHQLELVDEAVKMFTNFVGRECLFDNKNYDFLHLTFGKSKTKEEHLALINDHLDDLMLYGEQRIRTFSEKRYKSGWMLIDGDLVSIEGLINIIIPKEITLEIFENISQHVNEHLNMAEKELDMMLSNLEGFNKLYEKEDARAFLTNLVEELFKVERVSDPESYDLKKLEKMVESFLGVKKVKVW